MSVKLVEHRDYLHSCSKGTFTSPEGRRTKNCFLVKSRKCVCFGDVGVLQPKEMLAVKVSRGSTCYTRIELKKGELHSLQLVRQMPQKPY